MTKRIKDVFAGMVDEREEVLFLLSMLVLVALSLHNGAEWLSGVEFGGVAVLLYGTFLAAKKGKP